MAWFCRFWRMTPEQVRRLTVGEWTAMCQVMTAEAEATRS